MMRSREKGQGGRLRRPAFLLAHSQHRNTWYLTLNTVLGAGTGVLFWLLLARIVGLPAAEIGVGYAIIALGTMVGVVGKGGFDTALLRNVPRTSHGAAPGLLRDGIALGAGMAALLTVGLAVLGLTTGLLPELSAFGWILVGAIGILLVVTWLQDAFYIAERDARVSFHRNVAFSVGRLVLPLPLIFLATTQPVALTWMLALLVSAIVVVVMRHSRPERHGEPVPRRTFWRSARRNFTGSAAEFLPGLLLVPIVLAVSGAEAAGYFGIAWTGANMLFLVSAAISRSALATMVKDDPETHPAAVRRAVRQLLWLVAPASVLAILLAPHLLGIFGPGYAENGTEVFILLALSTLFVAPAYLYLGVLRAHERAVPLAVFPAAMVVAIFTLAPIFGALMGPIGVGAAWFVANLPFGLFAWWRLRHETRDVMPHLPTPTRHGAPSSE